jgi:hypothetical protein
LSGIARYQFRVLVKIPKLKCHVLKSPQSKIRPFPHRTPKRNNLNRYTVRYNVKILQSSGGGAKG